MGELPGEKHSIDYLDGTKIADRYVVKSRLGSGGMGTVYLAEDSFLENEMVALKMLHPYLCDDDKHTKRFLREVRLTRQVTHPNVVRTFDVGFEGEKLFFTMEYVPGPSLTARMKSGQISLREGIGILTEICKGLSAIHDAGILHRDLKPANVIITDAFEVKISDFGIAKLGESSLTEPSEVLGSCHYVPPEIWQGTSESPTVDMYALGGLAYELFTGTRMFEGDSIHELMYKHCNEVPVAPSSINQEIPTWLSDLILSMLEKDPDLRPQSARLLGATLEEEFANHTESDAGVKGELLSLLQASEDGLYEIHEFGSDHTTIRGTKEDVQGALVPVAGEELLKYWVSKQEKLDAIEFLESVGTDNCTEYLIRAVERYHERNNDLLPEQGWPCAGVVGARAARALGRSACPEALQYLIQLVRSDVSSITLRECGIYGMAGNSSDQVFEVLMKCFAEEKGWSKYSALRAIEESLVRTGGSRRKAVVDVLELLARFVLNESSSDMHGMSEHSEVERLYAVATDLSRRFLVPKTEEIFLEVFRNSNDLKTCIRAVEILSANGNPRTQRELVELLRKELLPEEFSIAIGEALRGCTNILARKIAREILEERSGVKGLLNSLSPSKLSQMNARRDAAAMILSSNSE